MARVSNQSTPTEINVNWQAWSDQETPDHSFPRWTAQTYDWKGRPLRTTNPDGMYKDASYAGCGCAGGEVVTLTDEVGRKQKIYSDVLGRTVKAETYNWDGATVYSTTTNKYNARDQITRVRQYAGMAPSPEPDTEGSGYQTTTRLYDGHARLQSEHVPEQNSGTATTFNYNGDDTIYSTTDARGVATTFGYNGRHLVTSITYPDAGSLPSGVAPAANVSYVYDATGNRVAMTDGGGRVDYSYDELSRLRWENRQFTQITNPSSTDGAYKVSYGYSLSGKLTSITDPFGAQVGYTPDAVSRTTAITGSGF